MALNFPSNPVNGQVYESYEYDSVKGAWTSVSENGSVIYASSTPPQNPSANDIWFNIDDRILYTYYIDVDSAQWIQIVGTPGSRGESGIVAQSFPPGDTSVLWVDTTETGAGIPGGGTNGQVLVKIDSTDFNTQWEHLPINDLGDVTISGTLLDGHVLQYNSATQQWQNRFHSGIFPDTIVSATNYIVGLTTETSDNIQLNFSNETGLITRNATTTVIFTATGYTVGSTITTRIVAGAAARTLTFPAGWVFVGSKPTQIAAGKTGILTVTSFGTSEADCVASWVAQI